MSECPFVIEIKGRKVCKFDYIQNPFTYRNEKLWDECEGRYEGQELHKSCYTYLRAKEVERIDNDG